MSEAHSDVQHQLRTTSVNLISSCRFPIARRIITSTHTIHHRVEMHNRLRTLVCGFMGVREIYRCKLRQSRHINVRN
jgi:hypothetical protein